LGFAWVPRIAREDRAAHELAGIRDGIPGYRIRSVGADGRLEPAPEADEYFPFFYSNEPLAASIYGLNMLDGGVRQRSIDRARDTDLPATTNSFRLQMGTGDRTGFFVALPVYRHGAPRDTLVERRRNLVGFVQGAFEFNAMVDAILMDTTSQLNVLMFDTDAGQDDLPVHVASAPAEDYRQTSKSQAVSAPANWIGELTTGDKRWILVVTPVIGPSTFLLHSRAWIVLCAGLLISALVAAYLWNSIRQLRRLEAANNAVSKLARTDTLTGLANRRAFFERLAESFGGVDRGGSPFAVQFIDLDGFKDINDTQGHATGDALLVQVAARLTAMARTSDLVARFGGDEFAVLQSNVGEPTAAGALAAKIVKALAARYCIDGIDLHITASVGVALYSTFLDGPKDIMMQADLALYRAKDDGRDTFRFHSGELDQQVNLRVQLADELRFAIERGELELHYQTQVEIRSGLIVGLEALVRWNHPTRGVILPSIFIPVAERTGAILALGQWVLERA
jgi:diguanylate cyclase